MTGGAEQVKSFGEPTAADGVDLAVRRGSIYGILGPVLCEISWA